MIFRIQRASLVLIVRVLTRGGSGPFQMSLGLGQGYFHRRGAPMEKQFSRQLFLIFQRHLTEIGQKWRILEEIS